MRILARLAAALILACAGPALATPKAPPPTAEEIAAARAEADALAKRSGVEDLFDNVTDSNVPSLRHKASGVTCGFEPGSPYNRVHVFPPGSLKLPRGDDVACETQAAGFVHTLYMTRYPPQITADVVLAGSDQAIRQRFPGATPYEGETIRLEVGGKPAPWKTLRFKVTKDGVPMFSRSSALQLSPWIIAHRLTGPLDQATAGDLLAEVTLAALLERSGKAGAGAR